MIRSLPIAEWPEPDRHAWFEACRPGLRLVRGGRASHLKPVTQADYAQRYGYFLDFLNRHGRLDLKASATTQLTIDTVNIYMQELRDRVSSVTVYGSISKLRRAAAILQPDLKLEWLKEIERDLDHCKRPRSKADRLVFSDRIVTAGITLMEEAGFAGNRTCLQRAQSARDGLMIALLAICPIRLKNFHALEIGKSFVRQHKVWWVILSDTETKSQRFDHRVLPDEMTPWIELYLERYRSIFPPCGDALWPSGYGGQLSYSGVERRVTETTRKIFGIPISPHMFRHCVPYTIANKDGSKIKLASALLQHTDPRTTEKYYNLGHNVESSRIFADLVSNLRTSSKQRTNQKTSALMGNIHEDLKGA